MAVSKTFKADWELDVTRADNVLNLELAKVSLEAKFLDDARVLAAGQSAVILALGTSHDHLAGCKDQSRCFGFTDTHDYSSKSLISVEGGKVCSVILRLNGW